MINNSQQNKSPISRQGAVRIKEGRRALEVVLESHGCFRLQ